MTTWPALEVRPFLTLDGGTEEPAAVLLFAPSVDEAKDNPVDGSEPWKRGGNARYPGCVDDDIRGCFVPVR